MYIKSKQMILLFKWKFNEYWDSNSIKQYGIKW